MPSDPSSWESSYSCTSSLRQILDQWVIEGGFGAIGRFAGFALLVVGAVVYFVRGILPTLLNRINPLFAAQTIENNKPTVRNSLINFLLLRGEREHVPRPIYQALENRAAGDLSTIPAETVVDRINVIRLGYVLIAILVAAAAYLLISPKNPLTSAARVLMPWAAIDAPTRVVIGDVEPKDHFAFHGDRVTISAEVQGLVEDEPVQLFYTTADGQSVDRAVTMGIPEGSYKYETLFPADELGLQQDLTYYLAAGDAKTPVYHINVRVAPTIRVKSTKLEYPDYTGLKSRVFEDLGDIRALEGTRVVVTGEANLPIKWAKIDLDCTGSRPISMKVDDQTATGRFTIRPNPDNPGRPEHDSYQLLFGDVEGNKNRRPIRHRIEMLVDQPPRISFVEGPKEPIRLPADGAVEFKIAAEDPDFALRRVLFVAQRGGRSLPIRPLMEKRAPEKGHAGPFEGAYRFSPAEFNLKPGDEVVYYAVAADNKEPAANRSETEQNSILIVEPSRDEKKEQESPEDQGQQDRQDQRKGEKPPKEQPDQQKEDQEQKQDEQQSQEDDKQDSGEGEQSQAEDQEKADEGESASKSDSDQGNPSQDASDSDQPKDNQQPKPGGEAEAGKQGNQGKQEGEQGEAQEGGQSQDGQGQQGQPNGGRPQGGKKPSADGQSPDGPQQNTKSSGEPGQESNSRPGKPGDNQNRQTDPSAEPGEGSQPRGPIDGESNPGDAFEEILKHRRKEQSETPPGQQRPDGKSHKGGPDQEPGSQRNTEKRPSDAQQGSVDGETPQTPDDKKDDAEPRQGEEKPSGDEVKQEQGGPGESGSDKGDRGAGNMGKKTDLGTESTPDAAREDKGGDNRGDDPSVDKAVKEGDPTNLGGKEDAKDPQRQKQVGDASTGEKNPRQRSPNKDEKNSQTNATGDTSGDRSGDSEEGGGQRSNQDGAGAAGQSEPSDAGGSKSEEKGEGETGKRGGDQAESKHGPSEGEGKKTEGEGSDAQGNEKGTPSSGNKQGKQSDGQKSDQQGTPGGQPGGTTSDSPSGTQGVSKMPGGGGQPGDPAETPPSPEQEDAANREYSEEAVNLALEHLKDQMKEQDPELLDRLGWTKEEASQFLKNWEKMRREAKADDAAKTEWEKAIESLGLRPKRTAIKGGKTPTDQLRRLHDAGRFTPPPEWAEQFRAYTEGASGGGED